MNEAEFWDSLEYRVCDELASFTEKEIRSLWCDGFVPQQFALDANEPYIGGRVWIGGIIGRRPDYQEDWQFRLMIGKSIHSRAEIVWDTLLPPENKTGWLTVDRARKTIVIAPQIKSRKS
ncbi:MAG: hypothetical protein JXB07_05080 [Anaerolineae bacterium]|nr:hypothetical protein [Anaerolineae bacterium]